MSEAADPPCRIKHFFVLMLENRSFDHMLGYDLSLRIDRLTVSDGCPEDPLEPASPVLPSTETMRDVAELDPPHEFDDVRFQITGRANGSYVQGNPFPMNGFAASAKWGRLKGATGENERLAQRRQKGEYALECQPSWTPSNLRQLARKYAVCQNWYSSMPGPTWPNRFFVHAASSGGLDNSPSDARASLAVTLRKP